LIASLRAAALAIAFSATRPAGASAWGTEGHIIVAEIAEQYLEPAAAQHVRELLALQNATHLTDVANWADQIRRERPETAPWHFVDIPVHPAPITGVEDVDGYLAARDCSMQRCIVAQIDRLMVELQQKREVTWPRLEALKFVVHFMGDIHQPLHAADDHDRGGNDDAVVFMGRRSNLHAVWDSGILDAAGARGDERVYAARLARSITPDEFKRWRFGTAAYWADESHKIAVNVIYGTLPHVGALPDGYETVALPIVNEQLEKAGVRLAMVLNVALR
jgi:hypothetical protein